MLNNPDLRAQYDKYGKEGARPHDGFQDPAEFFGTIFGGDAFVDLIGEISLMKDLTRTMDITMQEGAEEEEEFPGEAEAKQQSIADEQRRAAAAAGAAPGGEGSKVPPPPSVAESFGEKSTFSTGNTAFEKPSVSPSASGTSTPKRSQGIPLRPAIMDKSEE